MANQKNPGAIEGTEIIFLKEPFGGWVSSPAASGNAVHYDASIEGVQGALTKEQTNQYVESDGVTLFRYGKFGHLAPGQVFTPITDTAGAGGAALVTDLALNGVIDISSKGWVVLRNGRVVQTTASLGATAANYDPSMTLTGGGKDHSTHTLLASGTTADADVVMFYDLASTPVQYALWSWEDNTDADISAIVASSGSVINGWYSGINSAVALTKGVPHKMCQGPDGNLYITNGSYIEQVVINGALASATKGLELPIGAGWTATGIVSYKNYVAIIASSSSGFRRGQVSVFLWNGLSTTINGVTSTAAQFIYPIPDNFGNGIFFDGDILYALTNGRNNSSKIFEFTSKGWKKVFESPLIGTSVNAIQGSMENFQDSLMIGGSRNSQGCLFRFYGGGFHNEGAITDGTNIATSVGMVKNLITNLLVAGVAYGTSPIVYKLYTQSDFSKYQVNAQLRTILYSQGILGRRMYPLGFKGTVSRIFLYLSQWGTGASLTLSLFNGYNAAGTPPGSANDLLNLKIDTDTSTPNGDNHRAYPAGTQEIDISDLAITDLSTFYMVITFSHLTTSAVAAIICSVVVFWSPSQ